MKKERQRGGLRAQREVGTRGGGGGNGTKGDGNQEGAEKNKRERSGRWSRMEGKNRGKRTCAVNVESWQSG